MSISSTIGIGLGVAAGVVCIIIMLVVLWIRRRRVKVTKNLSTTELGASATLKERYEIQHDMNVPELSEPIDISQRQRRQMDELQAHEFAAEMSS